MSTTVQGVDARAYLAGWLQMVTGMTIADINAIPDDKWTAPHGGCARTANALLADTVTNLLWTTATVKGEESDAYNGMDALAEKFADKAAGVAAFAEASAGLAAAITAADDEALNRTVMAPWQMPAPVFTLATISVNHVWYHDGQFNYIQGLLGDGEVHWMA
ncbi:MAG: hypothetical protein P4L46_08185 [Fimbriimonas sp.]|nr:hypothetical protein [Fimbriimonas sp.]